MDAIVEAGPDLETDGIVRWRCADLQRVIAERYSVGLCERSVGRILNDRRLRDVSVRPQHPQERSCSAGTFQESFAETVKKLLPATAAGKALEIWFQDEARVGQKGTLAYIWARCGTRPRAVQDTRYGWAYLFGAVCPERAVSAGLVLPCANTEAMNLHLVEIPLSPMAWTRSSTLRVDTPWIQASWISNPTLPRGTVITQGDGGLRCMRSSAHHPGPTDHGRIRRECTRLSQWRARARPNEAPEAPRSRNPEKLGLAGPRPLPATGLRDVPWRASLLPIESRLEARGEPRR